MLSKRPNDSLYPTTVLVAHPQEVIRMNFPFKKIIKKKKKSTLVFNLGKLGEALITGSVQESSSYIYLCAFERPTEMQRTFFFFFLVMGGAFFLQKEMSWKQYKNLRFLS